MHKFALAVFASYLFSLEPAAAGTAPAPGPAASFVGVDLDDLAHYAPGSIADVDLLRSAVKHDPRFFAGGARFKFTLHLEEMPTLSQNGATVYHAAAMMADKTRLFFRKFSISISGTSQRQIDDVQMEQEVDLASMHFTADVALIDRFVVLEDAHNGIIMAFPLGVGGIDDHVTGHGKRILTPLYHGAHLDRRNVIPARHDPDYYRGKPFIPITNAAGHPTPVAFHITILTDDEWRAKGPNYLLRGFESHACMRLRLKDLRQLFTIVEHAGEERLPLDIEYHVKQHDRLGTPPYPMEQDSYMRIKNFGTKKHPIAKRDPAEGLLFMERVHHAPNLDDLNGFSADALEDMSVFEGLSTELE